MRVFPKRGPGVTSLLLLAITMVLALVSAPLRADDGCDHDQRIERDAFVGFQPGTNHVMLASGPYVWDNRTEFRNRQGEQVTIAYFMPGMVVETDFCPSNSPAQPRRLLRLRDRTGDDGSPTATPTPRPSITPTPTGPPPGPFPVHFEGRVMDVNDDLRALVVGNVTVRTTGTTTITFGEPPVPVDFDAIEVGQFAVVDGVVMGGNPAGGTNAGVVLAHRIDLREGNPPPLPVVITDAISSINPPHVVVGNIIFRTTPDTLITEQDGTPLTLADLRVGNVVEAIGVVGDPATANMPGLNALAIKRLHAGSHPPIRLVGPVEAISPENNTLRVAGHQVLANDDTQVVDQQDNPITLADISLGDVVQVFGSLASGPANTPVVLARRIALHRTGCIEQEFRGEISLIEGNHWSVAGRRVVITNVTTFSDEHNNPLTAADFAVGDFVKVRGCGVPGTPLEARHIEKKSREDDNQCRPNTAFAGNVEAIGDVSFLIAGRIVRVAPFTVIFREGIGPVGPDSIVVGDRAFVTGRTDENSSAVLACAIRLGSDVTPPPPPPMHVAGRIDSIDTPTLALTVAGRPVQASNTTEILGRNGAPLQFSDLAVGQFVLAVGMVEEGVLHARLIRVQEENHHPGAPGLAVGLVTAVNLPDSFSVNERPILIDDATRFFEIDGSETGADVLVEGELVAVKLRRPAGTDNAPPAGPPTAVRVHVRAATIEGIKHDAGVLTVSGVVGAIDSSTIIRERNGQVIGFVDLAVGDMVSVRFAPVNSNDPATPRLLRAIIRHGVPEKSNDVAGFSPTEFDVRDGVLEVRSTDPAGSFGFISLAADAEVSAPNTLYEATFRIATDVAEANQVPTTRLRLNTGDFQKGATVVIDANATASLVPNAQGREYRVYFVPGTVDPEAEALSHFFPSLDLLSFDNRFAVGANLRLSGISVRPVDVAKVNVVQTLVENDFANGTNGWNWGGAESAFTLPRFGAEDGAISLAATDAVTFGYWTKDTGVTAEPGRLYRARFLAKTNTENATEVPEFRVRLNGSTFEIGSVVNVAATGAASETLRPEVRSYDVYLAVPADAASGASLIASLDLLNFSTTASTNATVTLERFVLEEIEIAE